MKKNIRFGIWDKSRNGFWLRADSNIRLAFASAELAQAEIEAQNKIGFSGLVVKRFEANQDEI